MVETITKVIIIFCMILFQLYSASGFHFVDKTQVMFQVTNKQVTKERGRYVTKMKQKASKKLN